MHFERLYLNQYVRDSTFETYLSIWMEYRKTTDEIDGHIKSPRTPEEHHTVNRARIAGQAKILELLAYAALNYQDVFTDPRWHQAKEESLRRTEKGSKP